MINQLRIQNFKSHKDTTLGFKNLTILCGANGVGKSSAIQLLLLLRDNFIRDKSFDNLDLESKSVKVGTPNDAIYEFSETDEFGVHLSIEGREYSFIFEAKTEDARVKTFIPINNNQSKIPSTTAKESLFNTNFQYISAHRLGPQKQYLKEDKIVGIYRQISDEDGKSEYFVHFLDHYRNNEVLKGISNDQEHYTDLFSQVIAWEKEISEGVTIDIEDLGKLGYTLRYSFEADRSPSKRTKYFEATNVGFGLSYVMPILVAILAAGPDALIIIENPEAHLHPKGIAKLTELICLAAQAGVQLVIETHSDHIINGILVQCKRFEDDGKGVSKDNVSIYHFDRHKAEHYTVATKIEIAEGGRLESQPRGFFDQIELDLQKLMGF